LHCGPWKHENTSAPGLSSQQQPLSSMHVRLVVDKSPQSVRGAALRSQKSGLASGWWKQAKTCVALGVASQQQPLERHSSSLMVAWPQSVRVGAAKLHVEGFDKGGGGAGGSGGPVGGPWKHANTSAPGLSSQQQPLSSMHVRLVVDKSPQSVRGAALRSQKPGLAIGRWKQAKTCVALGVASQQQPLEMHSASCMNAWPHSSRVGAARLQAGSAGDGGAPRSIVNTGDGDGAEPPMF